MPANRNPQTVAVCAAGLLSLLIPATASAQAWVPPKGEGSVSVTYVNDYVKNHVSAAGVKSSASGAIRTNITIASFEYGLTDRFALNVDVAHVASKFLGKDAHGPLDIGNQYHPTFQDARVEPRKNALKNPLVVKDFG